jgi:hypothetical protein
MKSIIALLLLMMTAPAFAFDDLPARVIQEPDRPSEAPNRTQQRLIEQWGDAFSDCRNTDPEHLTDEERRTACATSLALEKKLNRVGCHIVISTTWKCER